MVNIAITAGGTSEPIDGVRKITNLSTGSLSWNCLKSIFEHFNLTDSEFRVYYILTENAVNYPLSPAEKSHVTFIPVTDTESVYQAVDKLTKTVDIHYFIHAMAISDFSFSYAIPTSTLANDIFNLVNDDKDISVEKIEALLDNPPKAYSKEKKISSKSNLIMGLKKTKKVISVIKKNNNKTFLVGFKLLNSVTEAELLQAAKTQTERNGCDMVFANDATAIAEKNHTGLLIRNESIISRPRGKKEIAQTIIKEMLSN